LIQDLVASIPDGAAGTDWSLVFADNSSTDATLAQIAKFSRHAVVVQLNDNRGYAAGVNAAVRAAGDQDGYLILNPDVRLSPGCVATLFRALGPNVGIAVPRLLDAQGATIWSMRREPTLLRAWSDALLGAERVGRSAIFGEVVTDPALYLAGRTTDWAEGSTQLISADCLRACGQWDESYFLYSEEAEYDLRARDHGFATWYEPQAVATHLEGGSSSSPRLWSLVVANRVLMFSRRHRPASVALFWLASVVREGSRAVLGMRTSGAAIRDLLSLRRMRQVRGPEWLDGVRVSCES
jgi:GT2 family glycosyltransferase